MTAVYRRTLPTNVEVAVQLHFAASLRRSRSGLSVATVQLQHRLLDVPLGVHAVPLVVVERGGRAHVEHQPLGAHVQREEDQRGVWRDNQAMS